jgi:hypothetical protein
MFLRNIRIPSTRFHNVRIQNRYRLSDSKTYHSANRSRTVVPQSHVIPSAVTLLPPTNFLYPHPSHYLHTNIDGETHVTIFAVD